MNAATAPLFYPVEAPGKLASLLLAIGMHLLLAAFLFFGVRWQVKAPEPVTVDLVVAAPEPAVPPPPTIEEQPPAPPQPTPKVEPPPPPKPEIAIKEKPKKPEPKPDPKKPEPKPEIKPEPKRDAMQERLLKESQQLEKRKLLDAMNKDLVEAKQAQARHQAAGQASARDAWVAKIRSKVRGNIVLPPDVRGNPMAIFEINQLPTGEVITVKLRQSSGLNSLDTAFERAILKSSPLPKPEKAEVFERTLNLQFTPQEN